MSQTAELAEPQAPRDRPATLTSSVYERLRREIVSAVLLPGQRLGMELLRARYGVGGSPLREALDLLSSEGLVTQEDQKGFRVAPVGVQELKELTYTRRLVNEIVLRESIRNGDAAWEERIVVAYHRLQRHIGEGATPEAEQRHRAFHRALILGCRSRHLVQMTEQLFDQAKRYQILSISRGAAPRNGDAEHRDIMEAVLARDVERAVQLSNDHISLTEKIVLDMNTLVAAEPGRVGGRL